MGMAGRKRQLSMVVRLVAPGSLPANPANPYTSESPEQRREAMLSALVKGLAAALRTRTAAKGERAAVSEPPTEKAADPPSVEIQRKPTASRKPAGKRKDVKLTTATR